MLVLSLLLLSRTDGTPVALAHLFHKGESSTFDVSSTLRIESKHRGVATWFPTSIDYRYRFTLDVQDVAAEGVAKVRYQRPTITKVFAEDYDQPEHTIVEKTQDDILLNVSSANEILDVKDTKPSTQPPPTQENNRRAMDVTGRAKAEGDDFLKTFYSLALFTGSLESSIDFNPRLPFDKVKPGDTWKRTATYAPQKLKGSQSMAVQRLDYTYTYVGSVTSEGKTVDRVTASLHFDTDVAAYLRQTVSPDIRLTYLPVVLDGTMEFDLSPTTHKTLRAKAHSKGYFQVFTSEVAREPVFEEKLEGETTLEPSSVPKAGKKSG